MPLFKTRSRSGYIKVYRPNGSRYAEGRDPVVATAIMKATLAFVDEFKQFPRQDETLVEILGVTGDWVATIFELKEPE